MIYTAGYSGHSVAQLKKAAEELNAAVVDVRLSPKSRMPEWNAEYLNKALGTRYISIPTFGNVGYGGRGEMQIPGFTNGLIALRGVLIGFGNAILLCGCKEYESCHRAMLSTMLRAKGHDCREIVWPEIEVEGQIKCLSLWQPYAWLMAVGEKEYETRSWGTTYRGPVIDHAAKRCDAQVKEILSYMPFRRLLTPICKKHNVNKIEEMGLGVALSVYDLLDCIPTGKWCDGLSEQERMFGNFGPKRFAWKTANHRRFEVPVPLKGAQGLFNVEKGLVGL